MVGRVDFRKAYEYFKKSQAENCAYSMIMLARMHEKAEFVDKSSHNAFELYRDASESNNSTGLYMVANYAEDKLCEDVKQYQDTEEMAHIFYKKSAEKNHTDAYVKLGKIFEFGLLCQTVDYEMAISHYKKAVEIDDNPEALNCLAKMYYNGKHLKQNQSIGCEFFSKAANLGNDDAMNNIGLCYEYGKGCLKNHDKAFK